MSEPTLELTESHLERIGSYVRSHFHQWLLEDREMSGDPMVGQLGRIENALEASIQLSREQFALTEKRFVAMEKRFEVVDKRFDVMQAQMDRQFEAVDKRFDLMQEQMDRRFEDVDKRFNLMQSHMNRQFDVQEERTDLLRKQLEAKDETDKIQFAEIRTRFRHQSVLTFSLSAAILASVAGILIQGFLG